MEADDEVEDGGCYNDLRCNSGQKGEGFSKIECGRMVKSERVFPFSERQILGDFVQESIQTGITALAEVDKKNSLKMKAEILQQPGLIYYH